MRKLGVMSAVSLAAVLLAGCLGVGSPWTGTSGGTRVVVAGDSEIYQLEHDSLGDTNHHMTDALVAAGYRVSTSDVIGANTADLVKLASLTAWAGWPSPGPQITVTALGVNDMNASSGTEAVPLATAEANYTSYLDAVHTAGSVCDVLVEIPETTPWGLQTTGPAWNRYLHDQATSRAGLVVPWASMVAANPGYVGTDGVHQTAAGKAAYLTAILSAVAQCVQQQATTTTTTTTAASTTTAG